MESKQHCWCWLHLQVLNLCNEIISMITTWRTKPLRGSHSHRLLSETHNKPIPINSARIYFSSCWSSRIFIQFPLLYAPSWTGGIYNQRRLYNGKVKRWDACGFTVEAEQSRRRQKTYLREVENLTKYFKPVPGGTGRKAELKEYLLYLINKRHLSEGTFRFYVAGLKFFYRTTLKRDWPVEKIRHPRSKRKLPVVLDISEVESFFFFPSRRTSSTRWSLMMTYSSGLRASETARLKLTDIDSKRMTVRVNDGKGGKDRTPFCPKRPLSFYGKYWKNIGPRSGCLKGKRRMSTSPSIRSSWCFMLQESVPESPSRPACIR